MPFMSSVEGAMGYGRPPNRPAAAAPVITGGSMYFNGTAAVNLSLANVLDFRMGTGDFTIEWFQYMESGNSFPRIFSIGSYNTQSIACSIESSNNLLYAWISSANLMSNSFNTNLNKWTHVAFCRSGTSFRCFVNGTQVGSTLSNSTNFSDTTNVLRIGNESTTSLGAAYKGYLTNFRWTKGQALYTANFTRPTVPLTAGANTRLLLLASTNGTVTTDSSGTGKTVTNNGVVWNALTPF
jgi:hypothetical protein